MAIRSEAHRYRLDAGIQSTGPVRRWLKGLLSVAGLESIASDGQLALGELVTNALRHAPGSHVDVDVIIEVDRIEVGVTDSVTTRPRLRRPESFDAAVGGRGLMIVDAVSDAWGVEDRGPGKRVWFRLRGQPARGKRRPRLGLRQE